MAADALISLRGRPSPNTASKAWITIFWTSWTTRSSEVTSAPQCKIARTLEACRRTSTFCGCQRVRRHLFLNIPLFPWKQTTPEAAVDNPGIAGIGNGKCRRPCQKCHALIA